MKLLIYIALVFLQLLNLAHALPLAISVANNNNLPSQFINSGGVDKTVYIVRNMTSGVRANNYIAYLPRNVSLITASNVSSLCTPTFTLQPKGQSGDSCVLELGVLGAVDGKDPNRFNHLFICLADRVTCVGPANQINVDAAYAVAAGEFTNAQELSLPLVLISTNNTPWRFIDLTQANNAPDFGAGPNALASVSCDGNACVVGGIYTDVFGNQLPLLFVSRTYGQSWTFIDSEAIPGTSNFGAFNQINKVRCSGNVCMAVGNFQNDSQTMNLPLLLISQSRGVHWSAINLTTSNSAPTFAALGNTLLGGDCFGSTCVAVGSYGTGTSTGGTSRSKLTTNPLLVASNNGGRSWSFTDVTSLPGAPTFGIDNNNEFYAASCTSNACVAVGNYVSSNNLFILPLIVVGNKNGQNWQFINPATISNLPANTFVGENKLTNVSCSPTACVATGYYSVPSTGALFPLLLVSNDGGLSWRFIDTTALNGVPAFGQFSQLYSASCSGTVCSASGNYSTTAVTPTYLPLLFQSKDSGQTWRYINTTLGANMPTFGAYNNYFDATCAGTNICTVVGNFTSSNLLPLTVLTNAANTSLVGSVWSGLPTGSIRDYPGVTSGTLNEIATTI